MKLFGNNKKIAKKFVIQIKDAIDGCGMIPTFNTVISCQEAIKNVVFKCYVTNKLLNIKECYKETACGIEATASYVNDDIRTSLSIPTASFMIDFDFNIKEIFKQELAILDSVKIQNAFNTGSVVNAINASVDPDIYRRDLFINDVLGHIFVPINIFNIIEYDGKCAKDVPYIAGFISDGKNTIVHSIKASYCSKRLKQIDLGGIDSVTMQIIKLKKTNWRRSAIELAVNRVTDFYINILNINTWEYADNFRNVRFSDENMREYSLKYENLDIVKFAN